MAGVCALAFAVGGVIRFNIRHAEPLIDDGTASDTTRRRERTSDLMLVVAYAISVCLYINILSSFLLSGLGVASPLKEHIVTCIIILTTL